MPQEQKDHNGKGSTKHSQGRWTVLKRWSGVWEDEEARAIMECTNCVVRIPKEAEQYLIIVGKHVGASRIRRYLDKGHFEVMHTERKDDPRLSFKLE